MRQGKGTLITGVVFLALAVVSVILSVCLVVFNQDGTGVNFGIIYTAFGVILFGALGIGLTVGGYLRLRDSNQKSYSN